MSLLNPPTLCLGTVCTTVEDSSAAEHLYQSVYKPLVSALYNLPGLPFTFAFDGPFMEWMEVHHPEFFMIIEEMVSRKQIEILGGGYYSPFFPLLPPSDRVGQVELLTTHIRKNFGKRPRGAWLESSAWEPALISSLTSCGMEYVLLDRQLIASCGFSGIDGTFPVTVEEYGKTMIAVPLEFISVGEPIAAPEQFLSRLHTGKAETEEPTVCAFFQASAVAELFAAKEDSVSWMQTILELSQAQPGVVAISVPGKALKKNRTYRKAFIQAGLAVDTQAMSHAESVKHALYSSPSGMNLYAKMMYVHVLVNQLRGDKSRKKTAREELWKSQTGMYYRPEIGNPAACEGIVKLRNRAYKHLLVAEKAARLRGVFSPSIVSFDFDMDGLKEYLCQLETLNMYVHLQGGKLFELDHFKTNRNFADMCRDSGGLFVDHFFSREEAENLSGGGSAPAAPVFADKLYQDGGADSSKLEIQLRANGLFGAFQQPISLRKMYSFRNEGIQLQCILKNESPLNLAGAYGISVDLSLNRYRGSDPAISVYSGENRIDIPVEAMTMDDVEWIRIDDAETKARFTLETNENASVSIQPGKDADGAVMGIRLYVHWSVDLGPNYETEKMVFLKVDTK